MSLMLAEMMGQRGKGLGELVADMIAITGPMEYSRVDLKLTVAARDAFLARAPELAPAEIAGAEVLDIVRVDGVKFLLPRRRVAAAAPVGHRAARARLRRGAHQPSSSPACSLPAARSSRARGART